MAESYVYVTDQDGETYEIYPTDGLLDFLQRLAEQEEQEVTKNEPDLDGKTNKSGCIACQTS